MAAEDVEDAADLEAARADVVHELDDLALVGGRARCTWATDAAATGSGSNAA
jgi:hypothetical protein